MADPSQADTYLSSSVSVSEYLELEKTQDKKQIVKFVRERFTERYITPLKRDPEFKHGFCTMAICCLMIETLESFWRGWEQSNNRSKMAFCSFFSRNSNLAIFCSSASDFYKNVRCGILHQAETTNGWLIRRDGPMFDSKTKTINATLFHNEMGQCVEHYCNTLEKSDWSGTEWKAFRKKMASIIANCSSGR